MHWEADGGVYLDRDTVRALLPHLQSWVDSGSLEAPPPQCKQEAKELIRVDVRLFCMKAQGHEGPHSWES